MMSPQNAPDNPILYQGRRFTIQGVTLQKRGGGTLQGEAAVTRNAVVILPLLDDDTVVLIRNERFVIGRTLLELPAGTIEEGEDPALCAARELVEETGYAADELTRMLAYHPTPGFSTELQTAYLARDLTFQGQQLDETERITTEATPLDQSIQMIRDNTIRDAKTIATLLYYQTFIRTDR